MAKTNFKCMFLIDDKLYKKAILQEKSPENMKITGSIPNSSHLTNVQSIVQPKVPNLSTMTHMSHNYFEVPKTVRETQTASNVNMVELPEKSTDMESDQHEKSNSNITIDGGKSVSKEEDCECYGEDIENSPVLTTSRNRKVKSPRKKLPKKPIIKEHDNSSDDSDGWEELGKRYRTLRADDDSPPKKENYLKKTTDKRKKSKEQENIPVVLSRENKRKNLQESPKPTKKSKKDGRKKRKLEYDSEHEKVPRKEFPCSFCSRYFKTKKGLERHHFNIHDGHTNAMKQTKSDETGERYIKKLRSSKNPAVVYKSYF